jgi:hypothetical protein
MPTKSWAIEQDPSGRYSITDSQGSVIHTGTADQCVHTLALRLWSEKIPPPSDSIIAKHNEQLTNENLRLHRLLSTRFGHERLTPAEQTEHVVMATPCSAKPGFCHVHLGDFLVRHVRTQKAIKYGESFIIALQLHANTVAIQAREDVTNELVADGHALAAEQVKHNTQKLLKSIER